MAYTSRTCSAWRSLKCDIRLHGWKIPVELRPTYAKLDISLARGIDGDDLRQALAAGVQYFASKIGCRLIAEGVESNEEAEVLQRLGIEYAQGYLFGRPELAA